MKKTINIYVFTTLLVTLVAGVFLGYSLSDRSPISSSCPAPVSMMEPRAVEWADGYFKLYDRLEECRKDLINTAEDCSAYLICKDLPLSYINGFPSTVQ